MEKIVDRYWGLLSNGFVGGTHTSPVSGPPCWWWLWGVGHFEGTVLPSGHFGALCPAHLNKAVMATGNGAHRGWHSARERDIAASHWVEALLRKWLWSGWGRKRPVGDLSAGLLSWVLLFGWGKRTLKREVFVQGIWQDGRVRVSLCAKKCRESAEAQTQLFSEIGTERSWLRLSQK